MDRRYSKRLMGFGLCGVGCGSASAQEGKHLDNTSCCSHLCSTGPRQDLSYLGRGEDEDQEIQHVDDADLVWGKVRSIMDTGAAESVAPPVLAAHLPIKETVASQRGAEFQTAGGGRIANQGERTLPSYTDQGQPVDMTYSVAELVTPFNAVSQICDRGNGVWFDANGGYIMNKETGNVVEFSRERGVYVLET